MIILIIIKCLKIKIYILMFHLKRKIYLFIFNFIMICSLNENKKNELIQLSPIQKINLDKMLIEINPKYELTTYLIDPINLNTCYLFIENTYTKHIAYFTIFLNDEKSLQLVKNKILHDNVLVNTAFDECLITILNIQSEIYKIESKLIQFYVNKFNKIIKIIYSNIFLLVCNLDKTNLVKFNIDLNIELYNYNAISSILKNLNIISSLSYYIRNLEISFLNLPSYNFVDMQFLESNIYNKIFELDYFTKFSLIIKINQIKKLSAYACLICNKRKIFTNHVIKFVLHKINIIENKLSKYTFMLCFVKIFNDITNLNMKSQLLKLMIIILLYLKKSLISINNEESLTLLYNITRKCSLNNITSFSSIKMCFKEDDNGCIDMKKVLIYRYNFFMFKRRDINILDIEDLILYPQYYELIWLIISCYIISIYNFFHINL